MALNVPLDLEIMWPTQDLPPCAGILVYKRHEVYVYYRDLVGTFSCEFTYAGLLRQACGRDVGDVEKVSVSYPTSLHLNRLCLEIELVGVTHENRFVPAT